AQIGGVTNTAWPYVTIAGGLLVALGGALTLARGRSWSGLSNRYEVAPAEGAAAAAGKSDHQNSVGQAGDGAGEPSTRDLWDALNRGADPTL
ncbi:MAG: Trp biosynthesis-associated membrane protein, partial [Actinocrinis sp.]